MCTLRVGDMNNPQINTHEYTQRACVCVSMSLFIIIFMIHPIRPSFFPYHCPPVTRTHTHIHTQRDAPTGREPASCHMEQSSPKNSGNDNDDTTRAAAQTHASTSRPISADDVAYRCYRGEQDLDHVMQLVDTELSEPYSVFTYRYFADQWPRLCVLATLQRRISEGDGASSKQQSEQCIGTIVCRAEFHQAGGRAKRSALAACAGSSCGTDPTCVGMIRGYIAMLVVDKPYRKLGVGSALLQRAMQTMRDEECCEEVVLEAEVCNTAAVKFYERMGFIREKRLNRYYLNGSDAFRLKLIFPSEAADVGDEKDADNDDARGHDDDKEKVKEEEEFRTKLVI